MGGTKPAVISQPCRFPSRDPESVSPCPVCGLTFPICQVGMDSNSSLHQRGTHELTWATPPMEDTPLHRGKVKCARPLRGAVGTVGPRARGRCDQPLAYD